MENKRLLTLFGTYSAILLFAAIVGISVLAARMPRRTNESETVVLTEIVYVFADDGTLPSSAKEDTELFIVREHGGIIGVFDGDGRLLYSLDIYVKTLPEADRALLKEGITVHSKKELRALIEDYSN